MTRVTFRIHYATRWGEQLRFEHTVPTETPGETATAALPMQYAGDGYWTLSLDDAQRDSQVEYRYAFHDDQGHCRREPVFRQVEVLGATQYVLDEWLAPELPDGTFFRQAFAGVIFGPGEEARPPKAPAGPGAGLLRLTLRAPRVTRGHRLCVSGGVPWLGEWQPQRALVMTGQHYPLWHVDVPRAAVSLPFEFKFGLWSEADQRLVAFEEGPNRRLAALPHGEDVVVVNCEVFRHAAPWKGAGVAIPVFSLRSERGYGVGEFADLGPLAEWAAACGLHLVQVLPVNDTSSDFTWRDSYPYKGISTAALHPIYLNIESLFEANQLPLPEGYHARRQVWNRLPQVDYEAVLRDKLAYLRQLYATVGRTATESPEFQNFLREQADWLRPYAAFCRLRDQHGTADFSQWGAHARYSARKIRDWFKPGAPERDEVMFHCFVQFHLARQLGRARAAGHALGVAFKGDLPIGIDRGSVEAWTEPALFHLDRQTGAPPDAFAVLGQNWGFPTYHWPRMAAEGYAWWQRRFRRLSACFDAVRIDHILGFFRIWEIPGRHTAGILGHFNPVLPLSREDVRAAGCTLDPARFTEPAVAPESLAEFFGEDAPKVSQHLLRRHRDGFFRIRRKFAPAASRQTWYAAACAPAEAERIEEGLRRLEFEVLFVIDPDEPDRFHPRIALQDTALFQALDEEERESLRALHDNFFHRRHTQFWEEEAMQKLPALMDATRMLICGEDLGMIPDAVPVVLMRLGLLSLEVQRWPKQPGRKFGDPREYPYLSVGTTSTHDMSTLRGWWEEDAAARQAFYEEVMQGEGDAPVECTPDICRFVIEQHLAGASMWCILPLQDWLGLDPALRHPDAAAERINVPANPRHYWRYRMHLPLEALQGATGFNQMLARLIADAGRRPAR